MELVNWDEVFKNLETPIDWQKAVEREKKRQELTKINIEQQKEGEKPFWKKITPALKKKETYKKAGAWLAKEFLFEPAKRVMGLETAIAPGKGGPTPEQLEKAEETYQKYATPKQRALGAAEIALLLSPLKGAKAPTLLEATGKGALEGAGFGTIGALEEENPTIKSVATGAGTGALFGAGMGAGSYGAGKLWRGLLGSGVEKEAAKTKTPPLSVEDTMKPTPVSEVLGLKPMREIGKRHPVAGEITKMGREAQLGFSSEREVGWNKATDYFKGLSEKEAERAVNLQEKGVVDFSSETPKVQKAILGMRWFNRQIKKMAQDEFGIDTSKWTTKEENYFHHMWTGNQAVVDKKSNKIIGFGKMKDAMETASKYIAKHPGSEVVIKPKFTLKQTPTTLLSQKGFWSFVNKMADRMEATPQDILKEMQGVAGIKPRAKFVGAFLQRKANLGNYLKNPEYVYKTLWNRVMRKKHFEPFVKQASNKLSKIENNALRKEMEAYIENLGGKYYEDVSIAGLNISKAIQFITKAESYLKLGYRPSTAFVNRLQPLQTAYPLIGIKNLVRGSAMRFTKKGRALIEKSLILAEEPKYYAGEFIAPAKRKWYNPLFLFGKAEQANREETLLGGYLHGKERLHFSDKKALEFGKDLVAATQFIYDASDVPKIMRSPLGKLAFQFKPFQVNYLYNAKNILTGQELGGLEKYGRANIATRANRAIKWLGANLAVGGLRTVSMLGKYATVGYLSYLGIKHPNIFKGMFNYAGIDLSNRAGASPFELIPDDGWELAGILPGDISKFYTAIKKKDYREAMKVNPMAWNVYQALSVEPEAAVQPTPYERVLTGAGFKPSRISTAQEGMRYINYTQPDQRTKTWQLPTKQAVQNMIYNVEQNKNYDDAKKKEVIYQILKQLGIPKSEYANYLGARKERMQKSRQKK